MDRDRRETTSEVGVALAMSNTMHIRNGLKRLC